MSDQSFNIKTVDPRTLNEIRKIAKSTAVSAIPVDPQKQLAALAKAILAVEEHCASVESAIRQIAEQAKPTAQ